MEPPPPRERLSPSHYLLFIWCLLERWYCSDRRQAYVGGQPAPCRTEGREVPGAKGHLWVKTGPPGRAGRARAPWLPSCPHAPLVDVSFFVTLQQDGSEGPKSLVSISMTVVLRLLEEPHYSRF